jgi:hypothetical protein
MYGPAVQGRGMATTPTPADAEAHVREFLEEHDLPQPDQIVHRETEIWVLYHEQKVVLVVELEDRESAE